MGMNLAGSVTGLTVARVTMSAVKPITLCYPRYTASTLTGSKRPV